MYIEAVWPETTRIWCVAPRGAISREAALATHPAAVCGRRSIGQSLKGGDMQASLKAVVVVAGRSRFGIVELRLRSLRNTWASAPSPAAAAIRIVATAASRQSLDRRRLRLRSGLRLRGRLWLRAELRLQQLLRSSSCGCGGYCVDGRKFAGRTYNCGCESYMPMCGCTGPSCCGEPTCGCGCGDCCEAGCGCEAELRLQQLLRAVVRLRQRLQAEAGCCSGLFSACGRMCSAHSAAAAVCGCSGEVYWSEWHNDPPRCCDPCNRCGQWVGPSAGCGCGGCGGGATVATAAVRAAAAATADTAARSMAATATAATATIPVNRPTWCRMAARRSPPNSRRGKSIDASTARASTARSHSMAHNAANPYTKARTGPQTAARRSNRQYSQR